MLIGATFFSSVVSGTSARSPLHLCSTFAFFGWPLPSFWVYVVISGDVCVSRHQQDVQLQNLLSSSSKKKICICNQTPETLFTKETMSSKSANNFNDISLFGFIYSQKERALIHILRLYIKNSHKPKKKLNSDHREMIG